jgi:hypothetical protein
VSVKKAYYASTHVGPYREHQVVVLDEADGWTQTGYLIELVTPAPIKEERDGDQGQDRP